MFCIAPGQGFSRWLHRKYSGLFPNLPDQYPDTRLTLEIFSEIATPEWKNAFLPISGEKLLPSISGTRRWQRQF
jgi:hypothetical protein